MKPQPYHIVRNSKIHGKGVFAKRPIRKGTRIIEYTGKIISIKEADKIGPQMIDGHPHTMLFTVDDKRVIDGNTGGDAKYVNHSCSPNCETVQYEDDKIYIESLRSIPKGEELTYDYHLIVEGKITDKVIKEYICYCGSPKCRHTQIAASIIKKYKKKLAKKKAKEAAKAAKKAAKEKAKAIKQAEKHKVKEAKKVEKEKVKAAKKEEKEKIKAAKKAAKVKQKALEKEKQKPVRKTKKKAKAKAKVK